MKKVTRILAALAAVTTLTVSAVPIVYANEMDENAFETVDKARKIADLSEISDVILFYHDGDIANYTVTDFLDVSTVTDHVIVYIKSVGTYEEQQVLAEKLRKYLKEQNVDESKVEILLPNEIPAGRCGELTETILIPINEFISEKNISASVSLQSVESDNGELKDVVMINIYRLSNYGDAEESEVNTIKEFMAKNNIDESCVVFMIFEGQEPILGDANGDGTLNIRDCAEIAKFTAQGKTDSLPDTTDYNKDGKKNVRDAAAISKDLASK